MSKSQRTDGNQTELVDALRAIGVSVQSLASVGNGCPDLLCGVNGFNFLIEVKDPKQDPDKRKLNNNQKVWHRDWKGKAHVAETTEQVLAIAAYYRGWK